MDRLDALADWERVSAWVEARNLVPLCRRHHRLKTHTRWTYQRHHDGTVEWTDPHGKKWRDPPQRE